MAPLVQQIAVSCIIVMVLVTVASLASLCRPNGPLNELRVRNLLAEAFPHRVVETVWMGADGRAALAKSGGLALVVCAVGEEFKMRQLPWALALSEGFRSGRLRINLADDSVPNTVISLTSWPPKDLAA